MSESDWPRQRTQWANERTWLAYLRTGLTLMITGAVGARTFNMWQEGTVFAGIGLAFIVGGTALFVSRRV